MAAPAAGFIMQTAGVTGKRADQVLTGGAEYT
jgi:hypothetical protein